MRKHLVIPDTQVKPGVPTDHLTWIGKSILEYRPDVVIHLGDHWDMHSLSSYNSPLEAEGQRYFEDIEAGNAAFIKLNKPITDYNRQRARNKKKLYLPEKHLLFGNHEYRIERYVQQHPNMCGFIGLPHLYTEGWEVHDFLDVVKIDGVWYSHYFYSPKSGRPWGGACPNVLTKVGNSFTQGHRQGKDIATRTLADGTTQRGLIVGSCYLHKEDYLGPQGYEGWHGIIIKHEVEEGEYDMMELSLGYLCRKYEQMSLDKFLDERTSTARSLAA